MTPTELNLAYKFAKEDIKVIQKIKEMVERTHPVYTEMESLYDIISNIKDSINLYKDKYFEMSNENEQLKREMAEINDWRKEEDNHTLKNIGDGKFAYICNSDSSLIYCQNCFSKKEKFILQKDTPNQYFIFYTCDNCGTKLKIQHQKPAPIMVRTRKPMGR